MSKDKRKPIVKEGKRITELKKHVNIVEERSYKPTENTARPAPTSNPNDKKK